jgi:hypothetical protein
VGEEFKSMTREQFNARLAEAGDSAVKKLLEGLGLSKPEELKARITKAKELEQAQLSETEKLQARIKELETPASAAKVYEDAIKETLAIREKAIPETKRDLLELAPTDPAARLRWLTAAEAKGLFTVASAAAPATETKPANSRAGNGNAPPPAGKVVDPTAPKKPFHLMTPEERAAEKQAREAALAAANQSLNHRQ